MSCIKILDNRGSKAEAQMTLGYFYLVHQKYFTYITEIKQALHSRILLPHLFSFHDYSNYEHKLTAHDIGIGQKRLRYKVS